ncbi:MAG: haloacid dehalogenase [Bacteroidetes bacterium SW_9_63_38]|nr:MAG: haloacid dehalogenase [Bacteroidetes bacterium SW_9_63_38]
MLFQYILIATHPPMPLSCIAVIFDLDGVIIDSDDAIEKRWREWAEQRDIPFEDVKAIYHGRPMVEVIEEVAPDLDSEAEVDRMQDIMAAAPDHVHAFNGVKDILDGLPPERWAIATSARRRTATNRLNHVGLPTPNVFVTADDVTRGKPAPDAYELAAERLDVPPGDCVVFEDAPLGIEAARRAGTQAIGVATSAAAEDLSDANAVVPALSVVDVHLTKHGTLTVRRKAEA